MYDKNVSLGRLRARRMYPGPLKCDVRGCKAKRVERHHKDKNTLNNRRSNVAFLCTKHHRAAEPMTAETKAKISAAFKGRPQSESHRRKRAMALKGRPRPLSVRQKVSAGLKAYYATQPPTTHCLRGHEYTEANTYWQKGRNGIPHRTCQTCKRAGRKRYNERLARQ